jgi:hypothetical protein
MSGAPAIPVWSVMAFVVGGFFYGLVLRQDQVRCTKNWTASTAATGDRQGLQNGEAMQMNLV